MDHPLMLVNLVGKVSDVNSKFVINEQAAEILSKIDGPIGVISVAGLYRTGKSFILNQLAGHTQGFEIGASIQPKTQGIWMWVIDRASLKKRDLPCTMNVILLDTEGLGSFTKTEAHDVKIFSLGVLLSSFLIFNSLGTIDDTAVENISLIVSLTRSIRATSEPDFGPQKPDPEALKKYFPRFLWLLRDFTLSLVIDGKSITEDEYLEHALRPLPGKGAEITSKNKVRDCIRTYFPQRNCVTLKRPVDDEDLLQDIATLKTSDFRPDYLTQVSHLIKLVYGHLPPKSIHNVPLTGKTLCALLRQYVLAINEGNAPVISSAWDNVLAQNAVGAVDAAVAAYTAAMKAPEQPITNEATLLTAHKRAEAAALAAYRNIGGSVLARLSAQKQEELMSTVREELSRALEKAKSAIQGAQEDVDRTAAASAARDLQSWVDSLVRKRDENAMRDLAHANVRAKCESVQKQFLASTQGERRYRILLEGGWALQAADAAAAAATALGDAKNKKTATIVSGDAENLRHDYAVLKELHESVGKEWTREQEAAKKLREESTDLRMELMNQQEMVKSLEKMIATLQEEASAVKSTAKQEVVAREKLEAEMASISKNLASSATQNKEMEDRLKESTEATLKSAAQEKQQLQEIAKNHEETIEALRSELEQQQQRLDAIGAELEQAYQMVEEAGKAPPASATRTPAPDESSSKCKCVVM